MLASNFRYQIYVSYLWFDQINMYKTFYYQFYLDINILFSQICYLLKVNTEHKENFHRIKPPFTQI